MEVRDAVAIVTGASGGIGRATARELAKRGAQVVLAARSAERLEALAAEMPGATAIVTDLRKPEEVTRLISRTHEIFRRIDILVNNAGQGLLAPVESIDLKAYRAIVELNVFAVLEAMQATIPVMRERERGVILNVSSLVSKNYFPGLAAYASTKYALNALSLTARAELSHEGIAVCVFHPKMTATDFGANALGTTYDSSAGRPGMQVDTAEAVARRIVDQIESEEAEVMM